MSFREALQRLPWVEITVIGALGVAALFTYGAIVPHEAPKLTWWETPPPLHVCTYAPEWTTPDVMFGARTAWEAHDVKADGTTYGPCSQCAVGNEVVPCKLGSVAIAAEYNTQVLGENREAGGRTVYPAEALTDGLTWATILLPRDPPGDHDTNTRVVAHELGHALAGLGEAQGPPLGCDQVRLAPRPGLLMHPKMEYGGWDFR